MPISKNAKKRIRGKPFTAKRQPPNAAKRVKKRKTILKESIGLDSWESIQDYITTRGASRFIKSLSKLNGRPFVQAYLQAAEYFKPKLARVENTGKDGEELNQLPPALQSATFEQLVELVKASNQGG